MATVKFNLAGVIVEKELDELSQAGEKGEEITLTSDELTLYKKDDFETFKRNLANEEYNNGKTKGEEMAMKAMKNASGYEIEGYKDAETFFTQLKDKITEGVKVEPNEKVKLLEGEKKQLQATYKALETEFGTFKTQITEKETRSQKDTKLSSFIPVEGLVVDNDIALMALKNKKNIDVTFDDGKTIITMNGEVIKNSLLEPVEPKGFITEQLKDLKLIGKPSGGKGAGDESGKGDATSYDSFVSRMEKQNISEGSQEFNEILDKEQKAGTVKM